MKEARAIQAAKEALRAEMRARLAALAPSERAELSARLCGRLMESPEWRRPLRILGFVPLPTEPDVLPALRAARRAGAIVALPRWNPAAGMYEPAVMHPGELARGPFGIPEPVSAAEAIPFEQLDLVIVPGLAFDRRGRRLGRGKGYYDRLLVRTRRARHWGVAFGTQVVGEVPTATHDVSLDLLATPESWITPVSD